MRTEPSLRRTATGLRSDPSPFANYLGDVTTITGGNGYSVTGRAILDYGGTYPSTFDSSVTRRLFYGETIFRLAPALDLTGGVHVENEHGQSGTTSKTARTNVGAFVETRAQLRGHLYVNGGVGFDDNDIFGRNVAQAIIPISGLSPGDYVVRASVTVDGKVVGSPVHPFRIKG